jgi:hypothetical protein
MGGYLIPDNADPHDRIFDDRDREVFAALQA